MPELTIQLDVTENEHMAKTAIIEKSQIGPEGTFSIESQQ